MSALLVLVPAPALAGFLVLAFLPCRIRPARAARVGTAAAAGSAGLAAAVAVLLVLRGPAEVFVFQWIEVAGFTPALRLRADALEITTAVVATGVGALVHAYAVAYLLEHHREESRRFFALMNLFLVGMLVIALADDLLLLFVGWELVGLCSFFLIGFETRSASAFRAARKAFVMTRIGDAALLVGLFLAFSRFETLEVAAVVREGAGRLDGPAALAVVLIAAGALAKSAQVPLQTWLPDAMAAPVPASALLHAATMVAAGAFLLARVHPLLGPDVRLGIALLGLAGILLAGLSALAETDLKRLLAFSTVSQVGFMIFALGVGAPGAAVAHFVTHAFFKSLAFLSAGLVSDGQGGARALGALRGARTRTPFAFWTFAVGAAALAGLPWVTAGFFSKELILAASFGRGGQVGLGAGMLLGATLTAAYATRPVLILAGGDGDAPAAPPSRWARVPVLVLAALSVGGGVLSADLAAAIEGPPVAHASLPVQLAGAGAPLLGAGLMGLWMRSSRRAPARASSLARRGFGFDDLYMRAVVRGFTALTRALARDPLRWGVEGAAMAVARGARRAQTTVELRAWAPRARRAGQALAAPVARLVAGDPLRRPAALVEAVARRAADLGVQTDSGRARGYALGFSLGAAAAVLAALGALS